MSTPIPEGLESYKRTPTFTETSMPAGLLGEHSTKDGVWGLIQVEAGKLRYTVTDPRRDRSERTLTPKDAAGVVEPTILHRVEPLGEVRFHLQFLRKADLELSKEKQQGKGDKS